VSWQIYALYISVSGIHRWLLVGLLFAVAQGTSVLSRFWLKTVRGSFFLPHTMPFPLLYPCLADMNDVFFSGEKAILVYQSSSATAFPRQMMSLCSTLPFTA
jgi:hypothetical protein